MQEELQKMFDYITIKNNKDYPWVIFIHGFGGSSETWKGQFEAYSKNFNLLLLNFHSKNMQSQILDTDTVCKNIFLSIKNENIKAAHFVSMSSGSLVALAYAARYPKTVKAMVMAGGMIRFNLLTKTLLFLAGKLKRIISYLSLYKFFAFIIMPGKNHKKSRNIFVRESDKLGPVEFDKWVDLLPMLIRNEESIKTINALKSPILFLYIMGTQDHLFKKPLQKDIALLKHASVKLIKDCGHVCTIEKASIFNDISIAFLLNS